MNYRTVPGSSPEFRFRVAAYCRLCVLHIEVLAQMAEKKVFKKITLLGA